MRIIWGPGQIYPSPLSSGSVALPGAFSVTASSTNGSSISVSWTASSNAKFYEVERNNQTTGSSTTVVTSTTSKSFTDSSGLVQGDIYTYTVIAENDGAAASSTSPSTGLYSAPGAFSASGQMASGAVDLTWTGATGATYYEVYRAPGGSSFSSSSLISGEINGTSFSDTTVSQGYSYSYWVVAYNTVASASTREYAGTISYAIAPSAPPTGLTASKNNSSGVMLSWNTVPTATSYKVYRNGALVATVTSTGWLDTGTGAMRIQKYQVSASNSSGDSPKSSVIEGWKASQGTSSAGTNSYLIILKN